MCFVAQSIVKKSVTDARRASARRRHPTFSCSSVEFAQPIRALDARGRSCDCGGRDALDEVIVSMLCARLIIRCSTCWSRAGWKLCKSCQDSGDLVFLFFPWVYALLAVSVYNDVSAILATLAFQLGLFILFYFATRPRAASDQM